MVQVADIATNLAVLFDDFVTLGVFSSRLNIPCGGRCLKRRFHSKLALLNNDPINNDYQP